MIQQASAWRPSQDPEPARLQELERSSAIRWVDLYGGDLRDSEALALLNPICRGQLTPRMVRDLIAPGRFPAGRGYESRRAAITSAFRTRKLRGNGGKPTAILEPVHLLVGEDWLVTCWLPPRVYRGLGGGFDQWDRASDDLRRKVAIAWRVRGGESAADLAELVRNALAPADGSGATAS